MKILLLVLSFLLLEAYAQNAPCVIISKTGTVPTFTGYTTQITTLNTTLFKSLNNPLLSSPTPLYLSYGDFAAVTRAGQSGMAYMNDATLRFMGVLSQLVNASTIATPDLAPLNAVQILIGNVKEIYTSISPGFTPAFVVNGMNASLVNMMNALTMLNNIVVQPSLDSATAGINLPVSILMRSAVSAANLTAMEKTMAAAVTLFVNSVANVTAQFNVIVAANAPLEATSIVMQTQFLNVSNLLDKFANNSGLILNNSMASIATQINNTFKTAFSAFPAKLQTDINFIGNQTYINQSLGSVSSTIISMTSVVQTTLTRYVSIQATDMKQQYQMVSDLFTPIRQLVYNYYLGQSVIQPSNPKLPTCGEQFASSFSSIFNANGSSLFFNSHYDLVNATMTRIPTIVNAVTSNLVLDMGVAANVLRFCASASNGAPECIQAISRITSMMDDTITTAAQLIESAYSAYLMFNTDIASASNEELLLATNTTYSTPINKFLSCSGMSFPSP